MKYVFAVIIFFITGSLKAQSPSLAINVVMDSLKTDGVRYKIEMKICKPKKMTDRGSWFSHDTSNIDFASLKAADIDCGEYFDKGMPTLISGKEEQVFNQFKFSNQVFAWEEIYIFRISNRSSRAWWPEMYIVLPVKYKSFITRIDITDIEFQSGKVVFITNENVFYDEKRLHIRRSLKNEKGANVDGFPLEQSLKQK